MDASAHLIEQASRDPVNLVYVRGHLKAPCQRGKVGVTSGRLGNQAPPFWPSMTPSIKSSIQNSELSQIPEFICVFGGDLSVPEGMDQPSDLTN